MRVWPRARARPQPTLRPRPCALPPPCAPAATPAAAHLGPARGITSGSGSLNLSYFFVRGHTPLDSLWAIPRTTRPQSSSSTVVLSLWVSRAPLDRNPCAAGTFQKTPGHTRRRALMGREGPVTGRGLGRHTHDTRGPDAAARAGPRMPPYTGRLHGGLAGTRATPAFHGTVRDSTQNQHYIYIILACNTHAIRIHIHTYYTSTNRRRTN